MIDTTTYVQDDKAEIGINTLTDDSKFTEDQKNNQDLNMDMPE